MNLLKREHGFECYLDETFTASDPIMAALVVSEVDGDHLPPRFTYQHFFDILVDSSQRR
jgi:hypothetical protein